MVDGKVVAVVVAVAVVVGAVVVVLAVVVVDAVVVAAAAVVVAVAVVVASVFASFEGAAVEDSHKKALVSLPYMLIHPMWNRL